ncbi:dehydrogenase [Streptomyces massasporeus]
MTNEVPVCPECGQPMTSGGLVLSERVDDGQRACRSLWRCTDRHLWWGWADRPDEPLEACTVPSLFR